VNITSTVGPHIGTEETKAERKKAAMPINKIDRRIYPIEKIASL